MVRYQWRVGLLTDPYFNPFLLLTPPPLYTRRLAADRGIQAVMARYQWRVGLLSELPPQGKVGISPVCVLGLNVNRGQEIKLRLRTDDLRGFRKYDKIRETLIHELAHMVSVLWAWDFWHGRVRETFNCGFHRNLLGAWLCWREGLRADS